ncbi:predicted protein [Lichtheimia corymbifera JMRC:FSU:9682]|uniref:Uncharacterized protein n=1 Tax=Lichtheimia corymbifera JMRC:FSU:9682 TaxID=1263082 RepID=A0A068RX58_9FUNG|nr:predicted protein [Lichtheimia corymbifera JMRC:FSU:9682]
MRTPTSSLLIRHYPNSDLSIYQVRSLWVCCHPRQLLIPNTKYTPIQAIIAMQGLKQSMEKETYGCISSRVNATVVTFQFVSQKEWIISRVCGSGLYTTAHLFGQGIFTLWMIYSLELEAPRDYFVTAALTHHLAITHREV